MPVTWSVFSWRRRTAVSTDTHLTISGAKVPGLKLSLALHCQGKEQSLKNGRIWHSCTQPNMLKDILIQVLTTYQGGIAISELLQRDLWTSYMSQSQRWKLCDPCCIHIDMYVCMDVPLHLDQSSWSLLICFSKEHLYQQ